MRYRIGFPSRFSGKESACNAEDLGSISGLERSPGGGNGNLLQYSCQENPMDRGAWRATVHGISKSQTQLKWQHPHRHACIECILGMACDKIRHIWYIWLHGGIRGKTPQAFLWKAVGKKAKAFSKSFLYHICQCPKSQNKVHGQARIQGLEEQILLFDGRIS